MKRGTVFGHKDKQKVIAAAKSQGLKMIWQDDKGFWHGAKDENNVPSWCQASEKVEV